jgi:DNA-binding transcriptional ArsR family regulator
LSHAEIAEILNVSHSTIEKHVAKGLLRCRDYLKDQGMLESLDLGTADTRRRARDGGDAE